MFSSETKVRVRYAETDQMGVVYHSNFFLYYEVARAESIRDLGIYLCRYGENGCHYARRGSAIKIFKAGLI